MKSDIRFKREVAYVQQDDLLFPTLTVYEQLDFAAKMLLREEVRFARVAEVLEILHLTHVADTLVKLPFQGGGNP